MQKNKYIVVLVIAIFFVISLLTNILGPIIPDVIRDFHVSLFIAGILPFCFFIAYGVMSIPAGFLVERWGDKWLMVAAFGMAAVGALSFAAFHTFAVAAASLFVMGAGMAALQVVINPLLRVAGGEEHFAFFSSFAQFVFGIASFLSPFVYSWLVTKPSSSGKYFGLQSVILSWLAPSPLPWVAIYWIFAAVAIAMLVVIAVTKLPRVIRSDEESAGAVEMYAILLRKPVVWLYFLSVIAYVGSEQGTADWMSQFLFRYHGIDPHAGGATAVAYFWGLLTVGCFVGMLLLKLFDSRRVLIGFSVGALCMLTLALFGAANVSRIAFPCIGLFASIMWPTIVSLGLNSVDRHHGPLAGILCTGIMGGALIPLAIGALGDVVTLKGGMMLLYLTFGAVLSVGLWAKPLINNAVVGRHKAMAGEPS